MLRPLKPGPVEHALGQVPSLPVPKKTGAEMAQEPAPKLLYNMKEIAALIGVPLWKLRRAVKSGLVPTYTFYDTKKYLLLPEVEAVILQSRQGGSASEAFSLHSSPTDAPCPAEADEGDDNE